MQILHNITMRTIYYKLENKFQNLKFSSVIKMLWAACGVCLISSYCSFLWSLAAGEVNEAGFGWTTFWMGMLILIITFMLCMIYAIIDELNAKDYLYLFPSLYFIL